MMERKLEAEGEMDYDHVNDILFFKIKNREYDFSLEFQNFVVDVDEEQFIVGIQVFDASKFLRISKANLRQVSRWQFKARLNNGELRIDLYYQVIVRNKTINNNIYPIIVRSTSEDVRSPQMVATV
jgi:uncharacterized protein YuzE